VPAVKSPSKRPGPQRPLRSDLASRFVDEAGRILSAEGAAALTLRRVAAATGTSTMAVYTLFGDKQGLLAGMYREGFRRLGAALAAVKPTAAPLDDLINLGLVYRKTALANPHLYDLMFGRPIPSFAPDEETKSIADAAYRPLVDKVQRCIDAGEFVPGDAERIALHLWAVSHGAVSLELAGHLPGTTRDRKAIYEETVLFAGIPFISKPADPPVADSE
jgi:AcrR family transcriptional regulator